MQPRFLRPFFARYTARGDIIVSLYRRRRRRRLPPQSQRKEVPQVTVQPDFLLLFQNIH